MEEEKKKNSCCLPPAGPAPWLVYTHRNARRRNMQTFCTISSEYCFKSIPELRGKKIFSSNNGWLILCGLDDHAASVSLWNPISSQFIHLPSLDDVRVALYCGLVLPHDDDNFSNGDNLSVFLFGNGVVFCYQPLRNKNSWVMQSTKLHDQRLLLITVVSCNDIIYGCGWRRNEEYVYVIIEVNKGGDHSNFDGPLMFKSLEVKHPDEDFFYLGHTRPEMLESCGRLYMFTAHKRVSYGGSISAVSLWELDLSLMQWVPVKCLDGRAFFMGYGCSTWCWGTSTDHGGSTNIRGNSVYFFVTEDFGRSKVVYRYDLEDSSITYLLPCPNLPYTAHPPMWVMSQHQRCIGEVGHRHTVDKESSICRNSSLPGENGVVGFPLCEFPLDLLWQVSQQLHYFDYLQFRATCKLLNSVAPPAKWRTNNSYPLLVFFESRDPLCKLMDPSRTDSYYMAISESFRGINFMNFSKNGWLVLSTQEGYSLEFLNPFSRVRGEYPSFESVSNFLSIGFSTCPNSPGCTTVGIIDEFPEIISIWYHTFGDKEWHLCSFEQDEDDFFPGTSSPLYYEGAFYFLDRGGYLGVFTLVNGEGKWDVYGKPQIPRKILHSYHLVECNGELLSVFIGEMGEWVRVFRLRMPKMMWVQLKSLGNYTLFVSRSSSYATVAVEREMQNRIYLTRRHGNGGILFYSLDTGKYSTFKGEEWIPNLSGTKEHTRCCWL